jgi:hypothetical protein
MNRETLLSVRRIQGDTLTKKGLNIEKKTVGIRESGRLTGDIYSLNVEGGWIVFRV